MKTLSEQGVGISNKKPRKAGSTGSMLYGCFVKVTGPGDVARGAAGVSVKAAVNSAPPLQCSLPSPSLLWPPGPPFPCPPFSQPLCLSPLQSATLTAHGEEPTKLPTGSESSEEEEEKLDLSSARRRGWGSGACPIPTMWQWGGLRAARGGPGSGSRSSPCRC